MERFESHAIWITMTLCLVAAKILTASSPEGDTAFQGANDRSRWCTVAALVEDGTYAIDRLVAIQGQSGRNGKPQHPWDTIDKVRHVGADGKLHYYSSKPTLLPTLVAGVYAIARPLTGVTLSEHPLYMPRLLLLFINIPLMALFLFSMMHVIEMVGVTDFSRRLAMGSTCVATMVLPFSFSLNNHLFGVAMTALVLFIYLRTAEKLTDTFAGSTYRPRLVPWALAGSAAALAVAAELPALSMFVMWTLLFGWLEPRSIPGWCVGALLVAVAAMWTNMIAHQSWRTPYAHRTHGEIVETFPLPAEDFGKDPQVTTQALLTTRTLANAQTIDLRRLNDTQTEVRAGFEAIGTKLYLLEADDDAVPSPVSIVPLSGRLRAWDDWYDYPDSHWRHQERQGVDRGEPNLFSYLLHATIGHHGIFSLTPLWLLLPMGMWNSCLHGPPDTRRLCCAIAISTLVCFVFYWLRPEIDRNYGGVSVCFRWMLWFTPLWMYCLVPELSDRSERWQGRAAILTLFGLSVFSVMLSFNSAWNHPWIYRFAAYLGWLD